MSASRAQRGASMIMATVFLVLVLALLGGIGLRMATTDVNDTALQNDAVAALFLAESGLERATQRLAAGTACSGLVPDGVQTLGRGDFQVTSATVVGSLCRVRVLGRVLLTGTMRAQRIIEADLAISNGGWAVGNNGTILLWNGTAWTTTGFTSNAPTNLNINAISCLSAGDCWAVGDSGTLMRLIGTAWSTAGFTNNYSGGENLFSIHCQSSSSCWATGRNGAIVRWNGSSWNTTTFTSNAPATRDLNAVSCVSSTDCWAIGERDGTDATIVRLVGTAWTNITSGAVNNTPNAHLRGVTCTSTNNCWGVGNTTGGSDLFVRWNGTSWSQQSPYTGVPNVRFNAVQCLNSSECWAAGYVSASRGALVRWNNTTWSNTGVTNNSPNQNLFGLHCSSYIDCWAVGASGASARLSGSTWSTVATPTTQTLQGVFFPSGSGGGSRGVQVWREIIL